MTTSRRDFLRVGGLGLCGVGTLDVLRAYAKPASTAKARDRKSTRLNSSHG